MYTGSSVACDDQVWRHRHGLVCSNNVTGRVYHRGAQGWCAESPKVSLQLASPIRMHCCSSLVQGGFRSGWGLSWWNILADPFWTHWWSWLCLVTRNSATRLSYLCFQIASLVLVSTEGIGLANFLSQMNINKYGILTHVPPGAQYPLVLEFLQASPYENCMSWLGAK